MDYDKIILEMLSRIKTLEEKVELLQNGNTAKAEKQPGTADIKEYISSEKERAKADGKEYLVLTANEVHKKLKLKSRMPAVCNAMKQCMREGDTVLHETASGFSSTYSIKYCLE